MFEKPQFSEWELLITNSSFLSHFIYLYLPSNNLILFHPFESLNVAFQQVTQIDADLKTKASAYNNLKGSLQTLERKATYVVRFTVNWLTLCLQLTKIDYMKTTVVPLFSRANVALLGGWPLQGGYLLFLPHS